MSVKLQLSAIFAHLYPDPNAALLEADEDEHEATEVANGDKEDGRPTEHDASDQPETGEDAEPSHLVEPHSPPPPLPPDPYELRINAIDAQLQAKLAESQNAAAHLNSARTLSTRADISVLKELDHEHGREHRKTGLPVGPSMLALETGMLDAHGLLHAHDLLVQVQKAQAARSAEAPGGNIMAQEAASRPAPHYTLSTGVFDSKLKAHSALIAGVKSVRAMAMANRERELAEAIAEGRGPTQRIDEDQRARARAKADATMGMEQQELELKVMRRLQAPLDFIRNPRFVLPPRRAAEDAAPEPSAVRAVRVPLPYST